MEEPLLDNENSDIQQMFFETNHKLIKIKRNIFFGFWLVMIPVLIVVVVFFVIKYGMGHPYLSEVQSLNYFVLTNSETDELEFQHPEVHPGPYTQPQQIHIALGGSHNEITISWITRDWTESKVFYGFHPSICEMEAIGTQFTFDENVVLRLVHKVVLKDLTPNMTYFYYVGSEDGGWSNVFWFKSHPEIETSWKPRFAIFGDMGSENAASLPFLQKEVLQDTLDMVIHIGDFAYDLDDDNGFVGDNFMSQIESIAAYVPYMTCPGNHEHPDNYKEYRNRFLMPISPEVESHGELHYSFDMGPIHFVSLNVEVYYRHGGSLENVTSMYHWFKEDLEKAGKNRHVRPWIVVFGHRAMYCAQGWWDCASNQTLTQFGVDINGTLQYGLEKLFHEFEVDLAFWGHKHSYERMWPVYDYHVYNTMSQPYVNPKATVHFTIGTGGSTEGPLSGDDWPEFMAAKFIDFGYSKLTVHNITHLQIDQISADKHGEIIDSILVVKDANFENP